MLVELGEHDVTERTLSLIVAGEVALDDTPEIMDAGKKNECVNGVLWPWHTK